MIEIRKWKEEYDEIIKKLSDPELILDWEKFEELSKKRVYLEKVIEKQKELDDIHNKIEENKTIIIAQEDPALISLAENEINQFKEKEKILQQELEELLKKGKEENSEPKSIILEIRAGTGGEEAALFATDLFKAYTKYAQSQNWKIRILDSKPTELGGFKEIIFELSGNNVFSKMKNEAGVHRVQRIPKTEKSGRIHTSTVSVAVLPKPKKGKIIINPSELQIDTYKSSGAGGQYVNKRMTAVRITHLPTGIVVTSQNERSLQQNKENALSILEARILQAKENAQEEEILGKRREQIGKAKRAEKIRTYNFPQNRVTDHRIKKTFHNIAEIMEGKLGPIISSF